LKSKAGQWLCWTGFLTLLDQITKAYIRHALMPGGRIPLIDLVLSITFNPNDRGVSWFVPDLPTWLGTVFLCLRLAILVLAFPYYSFYCHRRSCGVWAWIALIHLSGGILGNLLDDLFVPYTTDFIQFFHWPSANLADLFVYLGLCALIIEYIRQWQRNHFKSPGLAGAWLQANASKHEFVAFIKRNFFKPRR